MEPQTNPLILVFYLDRELMMNPQIMKPFAESVNKIIDIKKMHAVAFFLPTEAEERIECINPAIVPQDEMNKINKMVQDIQTQFSIGEKSE